MAIALSLAISLPYLVALALRPPGAAYMGYVFNPDEPNVYMSWMKQAAEGRFFMEDLFTTEPQHGRFFNVFFLVLGWLARVTSLPLPVVYHIARIASVALLLYFLYLFAAAITPDARTRRLAMYLAASASGLGWLVQAANGLWPSFLAGIQCVDIGYVGGGGDGLVMPEANTFLSSLLLPHFAFSMALMLLLLRWGKEALETGDLRAAFRAGLVGLFLGHIHTYDMIPVASLLVVYAVVIWATGNAQRATRFTAHATRSSLLSLVIIGLLSTPGVVYQAYAFRADPIFREKGLTITASPPLVSYLISLGLPLLLAVIGTALAARHRARHWVLPILWVVITLIAAYLPTSPFSFQRKMIEGIHLPICLLAAGTIGWIAGRLHERSFTPHAPHPASLGPRTPHSPLSTLHSPLGKWAVLLAVILCAPSSVVFVGRCVSSLAQNNRERLQAFQPPYYLPREDIALLKAFDRADLHGPILCLPFLGSYVPGLTGETVYVGHWAETLDFPHKARDAVQFFSPEIPIERKRDILISTGVSWVVLGEYERGFGFDPTGLPLALEMTVGASALYRVLPREGAPP